MRKNEVKTIVRHIDRLTRCVRAKRRRQDADFVYYTNTTQYKEYLKNVEALYREIKEGSDICRNLVKNVNRGDNYLELAARYAEKGQKLDLKSCFNAVRSKAAELKLIKFKNEQSISAKRRSDVAPLNLNKMQENEIYDELERATNELSKIIKKSLSIFNIIDKADDKADFATVGLWAKKGEILNATTYSLFQRIRTFAKKGYQLYTSV